MIGRAFRALAGSLALGSIAACAHYPVNPPLEPPFDAHSGYRFEALSADTPDPDRNFVIVTLSGGGTRAAAFAYGVLETLSETEIGGGRRLLDEVDVISSVSGGSFAAAYYGLYGQEAFFRDFPDAVLHRPIERDLALRVAAPWNWVRLLSPWYSRSDLADAYYDEHIFGRRTFADLPRKRPFIVLEATDLSLGARFPFTQEHFDRLCSNLDGVTVSRGVTASSAFPLAFTPLTLDNRPKASCGYTAPAWVELAEQDFEDAPERWSLARTWRDYEDAGRRPFVHLSDGGIADNIGLRIVGSSIDGGDSLGIFAGANARAIQRLVVIVVDAKPRSDPEADLSPRPPGLVDVLNAAATKPMENYSADTVERVRLLFDEWDRAASDFDAMRARCDAMVAPSARERCRRAMHVTDADRPPHPELTLIHVRFEAIPDADARRRLEGVPTSLELPREQVDELVKWAHQLLESSPEYRALVEAMKRDSSPAESP
ncbi:MAG TPA: patatin-like phospholipase family protein [Myxococcota bacterium]|nr:patatin-like phospholipase family protein [Myxococcota bacterium]